MPKKESEPKSINFMKQFAESEIEMRLAELRKNHSDAGSLHLGTRGDEGHHLGPGEYPRLGRAL